MYNYGEICYAAAYCLKKKSFKLGATKFTNNIINIKDVKFTV